VPAILFEADHGLILGDGLAIGRREPLAGSVFGVDARLHRFARNALRLDEDVGSAELGFGVHLVCCNRERFRRFPGVPRLRLGALLPGNAFGSPSGESYAEKAAKRRG
jgi:hypothetical protein